ncbi:MAG: 2-C-methyl-D-erythritol 2,4-cyclodiphosphate synthase [Cetobacterium sp.]
MLRIGNGYDVHRLVERRKLILGGLEIPHKKGVLGHSDGDVLIHSIMDALLGALALGDIGQHFPDTSTEFKDIDSKILLKRVFEIVKSKNYFVINIDCIIVAQNPKLKPYLNLMREKIAEILESDISNISIKATTEEMLGFTGNEEGIKSYCVVLLQKK